MSMVPKSLTSDKSKVVFADANNTLYYDLGEVLEIAANGSKPSYGISIAPTQQMAQQAVKFLGLQQS